MTCSSCVKLTLLPPPCTKEGSISLTSSRCRPLLSTHVDRRTHAHALTPILVHSWRTAAAFNCMCTFYACSFVYSRCVINKQLFYVFPHQRRRRSLLPRCFLPTSHHPRVPHKSLSFFRLDKVPANTLAPERRRMCERDASNAHLQPAAASLSPSSSFIAGAL